MSLKKVLIPIFLFVFSSMQVMALTCDVNCEFETKVITQSQDLDDHSCCHSENKEEQEKSKCFHKISDSFLNDDGYSLKLLSSSF